MLILIQTITVAQPLLWLKPTFYYFNPQHPIILIKLSCSDTVTPKTQCAFVSVLSSLTSSLAGGPACTPNEPPHIIYVL